jgi:hypothetical protein
MYLHTYIHTYHKTYTHTHAHAHARTHTHTHNLALGVITSEAHSEALIERRQRLVMVAMQVMHAPQMPQADALACKVGRDG